MKADGDSGGHVRDLMWPLELDRQRLPLHVPRPGRPGAVQGPEYVRVRSVSIPPEKRGVILGPVEAPREAVQRTQRHEVRVIRRHQRHAPPGGEVNVEFLFALLDPIEAPEPFEVGEADIGDHAVRRIGNAGQQGDLALVVGPHFHEGEFHVGRHGEQGEGHPDVVVQVAFRGVHIEGPRQDGPQEFLGGRLPVAPGQAEDRARKPRPVPVGQVLQGAQDILHVKQAVSTERRVVHHGGEAAGSQGLVRKGIAIEALPLQGKEELARSTPSGVSGDPVGPVEPIEQRFGGGEVHACQEKANPVRLEACTGFAMNRGSVVGISCRPWHCPAEIRHASWRNGNRWWSCSGPPRGTGGCPG